VRGDRQIGGNAHIRSPAGDFRSHLMGVAEQRAEARNRKGHRLGIDFLNRRRELARQFGQARRVAKQASEHATSPPARPGAQALPTLVFSTLPGVAAGPSSETERGRAKEAAPVASKAAGSRTTAQRIPARESAARKGYAPLRVGNDTSRIGESCRARRPARRPDPKSLNRIRRRAESDRW